MQGRAYMERLREMAGRLHRVRVLFPGYVSRARKQAWFRRADLYLFLSEHESYGLTLAEALRAGLPVLSSDQGSARDLVAPGCGAVVECGSRSEAPGRILDALRELLADRRQLRATWVRKPRGRPLPWPSLVPRTPLPRCSSRASSRRRPARRRRPGAARRRTVRHRRNWPAPASSLTPRPLPCALAAPPTAGKGESRLAARCAAFGRNRPRRPNLGGSCRFCPNHRHYSWDSEIRGFLTGLQDSQDFLDSRRPKPPGPTPANRRPWSRAGGDSPPCNPVNPAILSGTPYVGVPGITDTQLT